jgi:Na+-driven multidrug efflux pump
MGGALSTLVAQGLLCVVLLSVFLNRNHQTLFHSHLWQFQWSLFSECMRACFSRAMNRVLNFTSWAATAHLMVAKGGMHLLVLSTGGVVSLFLPFLFEAICQTQITRVASFLGGGRVTSARSAIRSGFYVVLCIVVLMAIPLVVCSSTLFTWLFPNLDLDLQTIQIIFFGNWLSFSFFTLAAIPVSHVLACKDFQFPIWMGCFNWINGYLLMYLMIEVIAIPAEFFWCALSLMHISTFCIYLWRIRYLTLVKIPQLVYE